MAKTNRFRIPHAVTGILTALLLQAGMTLPVFAQEVHRFDIDTTDAATAIHQFGNQAGVQILAAAEALDGKQFNMISGDLSTDDGFQKLLAGTGLAHRYVGERAVALVSESAAPSTNSSQTESAPQTPNGDSAKKAGFWERFRLAQNDSSQSAKNADAPAQDEPNKSVRSVSSNDGTVELGEVVVTGTHIRGAEVPSPVVTITQEEMRLSGHNNLGEVIRALPQNFSGGQNPGIQFAIAAGDLRNGNATGGSGLNLRGLGPDATLTLLNGTRLPYDGIRQATDVTNIPVAAIERMEILLDGASAIYGSDAVAGVANIILKRDYQGVELSARYGAATEGGYEQTQYTGVAGHNWGSGGFILTGDFFDSSSVEAGQRDYLSSMPFPEVDIYPSLDQKSALLSGHQEFGDFLELQLDAFYSERQYDIFVKTSSPSDFVRYTDGSIWGISPSARFTLPGEWSLRIHGVDGRDESTGGTAAFNPTTGALSAPAVMLCSCNETQEGGVEAEGPLFALPGGAARLSVGSGYRKNDLERVNRTTGATELSASSRSYYGYGEVYLPLMAQEQGIPFVRQLALNGAVRYEDYENYGSTTTPKIGVTWGLTPGLDFKASWGESFKTPTLSERTGQVLATLTRTTVGGPIVLLSQGGNPDVQPETAETVAAGFTLQPSAVPGFRLELGWFDIDYTDRITPPISPLNQALTNPVFAPFVTRNPTPAELDAVINAADRFDNFTGAPYDPATVQAILSNQSTNVSAERVTGVDLDVRYQMELIAGSFSVQAGASWLDSERRVSSLAPAVQMAGVSFFPPKLKGRLGASLSRGGLTLTSNINYIDGVENSTVTGAPVGASMTTLDLIVDYQTDAGPLGDIGFNLAVTNVLNQDPPFMQKPSNLIVPYDPTNYSALGRVVSATLTGRF